MKNSTRSVLLAALLLTTAALVSGCSTTGDESGGIAANDQPSNIAPVTDSTVSSDALPPIGGADGNVAVASAGPAGFPPTANDSDPRMATGATNTSATGNPSPRPGAPGTANPSGSFVSLNDVGQKPNGPGRDLSGGLTVEKLLGGWTVTSGTSQCRLNLTYTAKAGTDRYRASAPGCQVATLGGVSSWQLSGTQVQLFDDSDRLVGALLLSGNRFIGTLTGGQAISMVG